MRASLRSIFRLFKASRRHRREWRLDPFLVMPLLIERASPVIFDVGAHVGETALRYRSLFQAAVIHCFEPSPDSFRELRLAVAGDERAHAYELAFSNSAGSAILNVNKSQATNSLLASANSASSYWGHGLLETEKRIEVKVRTVDDFCQEHGIDRINILKLDVQGAEYAVLCGAGGMLRRHSIDLLYMEVITAPTYVGQHRLHEYLALFDEYGYALFDLYHPVRRRGRLMQADLIIVSPECLARHERAS
jgi:FkbM family methyltransferase